MDTSTNQQPPKKPVSLNTIPIRIKKSTARLLKAHVNECNRKSHGKRVKADAVIAKALSLINETHIQEIQRSTYTSQDQLDIEFKKYCSAHGSVTKDEFLKLVLTSALPTFQPTNANDQESL